MNTKPVVIAGGGLAGLSCASLLQKNKIPYLLVEASDHLGGRVATQNESGFTLDVGFQVLLNSYPELPHILDLEKLELQKFNSGALICSRTNGEFHNYLLANPVQHPKHIFSGLFSNFISIADKSLVLKLIAKAHSHRKTFGNTLSTEDFLKDFGFSSEFIELFWRPFLSGVFLDPKLSLDSDYFLFLIRCFSTGAVTIPKQGMASIPKQIAAGLGPENIRLNTKVINTTASKVFLSNQEEIEASHIVYAYNQTQPTSDYHSVSTYYFSCDQDLPWDKWLVLIPPTADIKINHLAVISAVNPACAPTGKHLISASVVGSTNEDARVILENLNTLTQNKLKFDFLRAFHVTKALPKISHKGIGIIQEGNRIYCGDHLSSPSINGALRSGRLAAEAIIKARS